eukprot:6196122-Pleurochrysis_carterae.AAC.6
MQKAGEEGKQCHRLTQNTHESARGSAQQPSARDTRTAHAPAALARHKRTPCAPPRASTSRASTPRSHAYAQENTQTGTRARSHPFSQRIRTDLFGR